MSEFTPGSVESPVSPAAATPSAPAQPVATPQAPAQQFATPAAPQAPATGAPEVEPSWLRGRLQETRQAAIRQANEHFAQREAAIRAESERYKAMVQQLAGFSPQNQNPEVDAIREQFSKIYPGLSKMEAQAAQLEALLERAGDMESQNEHYWQSYGRQSVDRLFTKASEAIGAPLSEEAKRFLHSSFVGYVQSSPEIAERYASDPTVVDDYLRIFSSSVIDPSRRQASATVAGRAPHGLPQDSPAGAPMVQGAPKLQNLDERAAAGWAAYQAGKL